MRGLQWSSRNEKANCNVLNSRTSARLNGAPSTSCASASVVDAKSWGVDKVRSSSLNAVSRGYTKFAVDLTCLELQGFDACSTRGQQRIRGRVRDNVQYVECGCDPLAVSQLNILYKRSATLN